MTMSREPHLGRADGHSNIVIQDEDSFAAIYQHNHACSCYCCCSLQARAVKALAKLQELLSIYEAKLQKTSSLQT